MPIDAKEAERVVLLEANEDYCGLYEAIWELNGLHEESTLGEVYGAAERDVRSLLERDWIKLYRRPDFLSGGQIEKIDTASVEEVLSNPVSWYPEYGGEC